MIALKNKAKFKNLNDFGVLDSDFSGLRISVASITSTALFPTKITDFYDSINHETKMTYPGLSMEAVEAIIWDQN